MHFFIAFRLQKKDRSFHVEISDTSTVSRIRIIGIFPFDGWNLGRDTLPLIKLVLIGRMRKKKFKGHFQKLHQAYHDITLTKLTTSIKTLGLFAYQHFQRLKLVALLVRRYHVLGHRLIGDSKFIVYASQ